jgi:hypothetical protein
LIFHVAIILKISEKINKTNKLDTMSFINWGGESPEQRALRAKFEQDALLEQAARLSQARNRGTNTMFGGAAGGGSVPPTGLQFVVNTTQELDFRIEFTSTNEPIEFTIDWGDGNTYEGSGSGGFYSEEHTYDEGGEYTVKVTFDDPLKVLQLDFPGWDDNYSSLVSITGLQTLANLQEFRADYNSLVSVDFSGMTNLTYIDISDCDDLDTEAPSLTSVNVSGCTSLEFLYLDDSDFSAGTPDLTGLNDLQYIDFDDCNITSIDLSMLPSLRGFDLSNNDDITNVIISNTQPLGDGESVDVDDGALTEEAVDNILVALSTNGVSNGYVDLSGVTNAAPSEIGLAAKEVLEGNGWTVDVNILVSDLSIPASIDFDITGDFTIEMFVNFNQLDVFGTSPRPYSFGAFPTAANAISFQTNQIIFWANGDQRSVGSFTPTLGQWYHICAMRTSGNIDLFIDGINVASNPYPDPIPSQGLPLAIGYGNEPNSSLDGFISNFRWSDTAQYSTAGFTSPAAPFTVPTLPTVKLLLFQGTTESALLNDNSGNGNSASGTQGFAYSTNDPFSSAQGSLQVGTV